MKKKKRAAGEAGNIISIQLDANFFFERAIRSLDRNRYDKALKYFQKAVDFEPNNPINYCNMAGVLSEIGQYGESNHILQKVINEIDPAMTECHFYMANNFANMEHFEEAERELIQYLQEDEEGQFLEEAEEMMEFLQSELDYPTPITKVKARAGLYEHIHARELLESGQFKEAIKLLELIVEEHPDFLAAMNNLALAYYYVGNKTKAKQMMLSVLDKDESNLHALCNLAIYYYYEGETTQLKALLNCLLKIDPFYQEHLFKLATTLGILKEHQSALRHFERLIKYGEAKNDPCICHYAAIAAFNIKRYDTALKYWQMNAAIDEKHLLPQYFMELTNVCRLQPLQTSLPYSYHKTVEEQLTALELTNSEKGSLLEPQISKAYFLYALRYGDYDAKLRALQAVEPFIDHQIIEQLEKLVEQPMEHELIKRMAMFLLRSKHANSSTLSKWLHDAMDNDEGQTKNCYQLADTSWEQVAEIAVKNMRDHYHPVMQHDVTTLWINYLAQCNVEGLKLTNLEAWAGALEYLTAKMHQKTVTYHDVALRYGTNISAISKRVKMIDEACQIRNKLKQMKEKWYKKGN